jgi:ABC-type nickel/cobalt efflux system permease component RcnA
VPKDNHDRTILVRLTPEAVLVDYRLELDEYRAVRDLPREEFDGLGDRKGFHAAFARYFAPILANNLVARLDGKELEFTCQRHSHQLLDHVRCDFRFRAPWKLAPGKAHSFSFREGNYELDNFSILRVALSASPLLTVRGVTAPSDALLEKHPDLRRPGEGEQLRRASATVLLQSSPEAGSAKPALVPDPEPTRRGPRARSRFPVAITRSAPTVPVAHAYPEPPETIAEAESGEEHDHSHSLLHLLLDTRRGLAVLLLLACIFGAAHALTPGHGKTLVAAYLVGERGTMAHALLLGLVTALTHTGAVLILAGLLPILFPDALPATVQSVLGLVGGLLIAGLGLWLLMQRLAGRADHVHLGGHGHGHGHGHGEELAVKPTLWGLVLLGISGGIVPCWDAIAMLAFAISAQRLALALPMLVAFSVGLAGTLVAVGVSVVWARDWVARRGTSDRLERLARALPLASAMLITGMGLWLCFGAARLGP